VEFFRDRCAGRRRAVYLAPRGSGTLSDPAHFHIRSLVELVFDSPARVDRRPAVERIPFRPASPLDLPPLAFGDTDLRRPGIVQSPPGTGGAERLERPRVWAYVLRDAVVHGRHGIVTQGDRVVAESLYHVPLHDIAGAGREPDQRLRLPLAPPAVQIPVGYHLLAGNLGNYYHWMVDGLSRFSRAVLDELGGGPEAAAAPVVLVSEQATSWQRQSLDLLLPPALPRIALMGNGCVAVSRLIYLPDLSGGAFLPHPALLDAFDRIRAAALEGWPESEKMPSRRIYVARSDSNNRVLVNEPEVAGLAARAGFTRVALSDLPVIEQVRLFASASHVLAPHGAGLTNIAFCRPGAAVCELHMDSYVQWAFRRLAALRGLRYGCVVGTTVGPRHDWVHSNAWTLDIARLATVLG
jgi:capsular polysaccharide biosynthesis protein